MKKFLTVLPYTLPCKFCRSSLITYYEELPFELESTKDLSTWMYKIHGKVNNKLRSQGQTIPKDPSYSLVKKIYTERLHYGCTQTEFPGWEFLFSIIENQINDKTSTPLPDAPPLNSIEPSDHKTLLRWNYLDPTIRNDYICDFWTVLPKVLPFKEWRDVWSTHDGELCSTKKSLWKIRCSIERELDLVNKTKFNDICTTLKNHRSGCSKSRNARTCRKKR